MVVLELFMYINSNDLYSDGYDTLYGHEMFSIQGQITH
jgi:hypothetical protein